MGIGSLGDTSGKPGALSSQGIDVGRDVSPVAIATEMVRSQRIDGNEQDVSILSLRFRDTGYPGRGRVRADPEDREGSDENVSQDRGKNRPRPPPEPCNESD